jgi:hypothetical protein
VVRDRLLATALRPALGTFLALVEIILGALLQGIKQSRRVAINSPPFGSHVSNVWNNTSTLAAL